MLGGSLPCSKTLISAPLVVEFNVKHDDPFSRQLHFEGESTLKILVMVTGFASRTNKNISPNKISAD